MKLRRCFSLLLAVLLVVMSFVFSASRAWAASYFYRTYSNFGTVLTPSGSNALGSGILSVNGIDNGVLKYSTLIPSNTGIVTLEFSGTDRFLSTGITDFGFYFRFDSLPSDISNMCLYLQYIDRFDDNDAGRFPYKVVPMVFESVGGGIYYASCSISASRFSPMFVYLFSSRPDLAQFGDNSFAISKLVDVSSSGFGSSFSLSFSRLEINVGSSTSSDKYQNNVSSGIFQIKDSVQKGFSAVTGAIGGAASAIGDKIGQVKDAVVQQGQAVAEKVAEVKEAVVEKTTEIKDTVVEKTEEVKQTIIEKLAALGNFIIDGLKELFIPSEDYFPGLFERLNTFFSNRFGFLYFPIEHFISLIGKLMNLQDVAPSIAIPELSYEGQVFIPAMTYTFDFLSQEPFKTVHDYYLLAIDAALIAAFIGLLHRKYEEVMRN